MWYDWHYFYDCSVFAFGESYPVLFTARALQGLGSACSSVSGEFAMRTIIQAKKITRLDNNQFEVFLKCCYVNKV